MNVAKTAARGTQEKNWYRSWDTIEKTRQVYRLQEDNEGNVFPELNSPLLSEMKWQGKHANKLVAATRDLRVTLSRHLSTASRNTTGQL